MNDVRIKHSLFIIFFLALLIRTGYAFFFVETEYLVTEDQALYIRLAQEFTTSGFLGVTPERTPGYPLFVSTINNLFDGNLWNVVIVQNILDSISCIVIALMAKSIFNKGLLVSGILSAINLNMVVLSSTLLTDTLFLFFFILFLFSLLKYFQSGYIKWVFFLALFLSLSTLVRAASYYLLPIILIMLVIFSVWKKDNFIKTIKLILLYLVVIGVFLGSIHHRNYQQYGSTAFVSQSGIAMLGWIVPATYQYSGQGNYQEGQLLAKEKLALSLQNDKLDALPSNPFENSLYQVNVGKDILSEFGIINVLKAWTVSSIINLLAPSVAFSPALRAIDHPSFYATKGNGMVEKLFNYIKNNSGLLYLSILTIGTIISLIFMVMVLFGAFRMTISQPLVITSTLFLIVGYFLTITGTIIGVKYRLPLEPIFILFATYFLNGCTFKYRESSKNSN